MKKGIALLLAGTMSFGMASVMTGGAALAEEKKDVTLTFGSHQSGLPTSGIVQDLAKEYEEKTGVKIDFQVIPDAQWRDLLKVKLDSGEEWIRLYWMIFPLAERYMESSSTDLEDLGLCIIRRCLRIMA